MTELLIALLAWIGANSPYETAEIPLPQVIPMTPAEITAEFYSAAQAPPANTAPEIDPRILGLYDMTGDGRIFIIAPELTDGVQPGEDPLENPIFQERLLHELVHHVQHQTGAYDGFLCQAQGEADAYMLGGLYLARRHVSDPLPNRHFWARIYSRC
ncbi:MAG: hypothetical protein ACPGNV_13035 [Mangrovicoccus sp.]